jgi:glycosyltransferase involved in cell wall biosynthesis
MTSTTVLHVQKVGGISGSETHLLSLLPRLKERGWDIRFLMLHEHEPGAWEFARALEAGGIPLDAIPIRSDVDPVAFVRVLAYLLRNRPTILHTHLVHADAYGQLTGILAGVPIRLSTKHGFNEFRESRAFALGDRFLATIADRQVSISRGLARYLVDTEGFRPDDFEIVHYGLASLGEPTPYEGPPRFLCIGRLIPIKGHVVLFRAFRAALAEEPGLRLDIAGRGPLDHGLKALARELGIDHAVRFLGQVVPPQRAIEDVAVVVVPSLGEGFGMVALEAMERGRPVIAARIGGLEDIVRDGETGILIPPVDAEALTGAMLRLARDPELARRMGEAGRRRMIERFPEDRCTDRTEWLYRSWLARRGDGDLRRLDARSESAAAASSTSTKSHGTR